MFTLTWKRKATPLGRPYYQLAASALRTSGNDCGSWPTPTLHDAERGGQEKRAMGETRHGSNLQDFALTASWATPNARDWKSENISPEKQAERLAQPRGKPLSEQAFGTISPGSPAQTESSGQPDAWATPRANKWGFPDAHGSTEKPTGKGQLNPSFSLWLMGYPSEWLSYAPSEMPSSRKSRQSSSKRQT